MELHRWLLFLLNCSACTYQDKKWEYLHKYAPRDSGVRRVVSLSIAGDVRPFHIQCGNSTWTVDGHNVKQHGASTWTLDYSDIITVQTNHPHLKIPIEKTLLMTQRRQSSLQSERHRLLELIMHARHEEQGSKDAWPVCEISNGNAHLCSREGTVSKVIPILEYAVEGEQQDTTFLETTSGSQSTNKMVDKALDLFVLPAAVAVITDVILNFVATDMYSTIMDYVTDAGIAEIANDVALDASKKVLPKLYKDLKSQIPKLIYEPLGKNLFDSVKTNLTQNIRVNLLEPVVPAVVFPLASRISTKLGVDLRRVLSRVVTIAICKPVIQAVTHAVSPSVINALQSSQETQMCQACFATGQLCAGCQLSPQGMEYTLYHTSYYSDYYSEYYAAYYEASVINVDAKLHGKKK
mmetsp:Transcript_25555/g.49745  ORF Transcript_25555/g.49745 Transcript_25555/m.49745 type:complete len:408 (-) Transcript_25555:56-1279(-)